MDQFNLELEGELSPEKRVGSAAREYPCAVSNHSNLYHLGNVLDRIKPGRRDVVVLHVRLLRRSASGKTNWMPISSSQHRAAFVLSGRFPCRKKAREIDSIGRRCSQ